MTADHCRAIMRNLPIIQAVAEGRAIFFASFDYAGRFLGWKKSEGKVVLTSLQAGFYAIKPRYRCMKESKPIPIAYPHQLERLKR